MSADLLPFPFIEFAVRAVAILILCVLPVLMLSLPTRAPRPLITNRSVRTTTDC